MSTTISSSSVDGLVSGLDTGNIVSQLVSIDSIAQNRLKASVSTAQSKVSALQSINTKVAALQAAVEGLQKAATWTASKATSSSDAVAVAAAGATASGAVTVQVSKLATPQSVLTAPVTNDAAGLAALGFPLEVEGQTFTVPSVGSLTDVAAAINKMTNLGVTAVAVRVAENTYRLQITSTRTGSTEGAFDWALNGTPDPALGEPPARAVASSDARFHLLPSGPSGVLAPDGSPQLPADAVPLTSASNSYANVMPGVSFTAVKTGVATLSVSSDPNGLADSLKALVDTANAALSEITKHTRSGSVGATGAVSGGGVLRGDAGLRNLQSGLIDAVTAAVGGVARESVASLGIKLDRFGALSFDRSTFLAAYAADPGKVQGLVSAKSLPVVAGATRADGLAERITAVTKAATQVTTGSIAQAIKGQTSSIESLNTQIADWDRRLASKRERYEKYYAALEVSLGKLKSQGTWLSGQLASLG
ncbi:flagellar filament capping protein FliD [Kineococcus terrestris]|uniref:flagellar filament capping protein FliD n=1 Tax=Kineococcus terrestris TaxID=2044856 RepID=UPI0034DB14E1